MPAMDLGDRIQMLRKQQGLSQEELADRLGLSRQAIGKWESGNATPNIDNLLELSDIFHTTADYLLTGQEPPVPASDCPQQSGQADTPEAVQVLQETARPILSRKTFWIGGIFFLLILAALLCLVGFYAYQVNQLKAQVLSLQSSVANLDSQLQSSLSGFQSNIEGTLEQQSSLLSDYNCTYGDYDQATGMLSLHLTATPKTLTENTRLFFAVSPAPASLDTLEEAITVEAFADAAGNYTAVCQVPLVQDFVISMLLEQDGIRQTQLLSNETDVASRYRYTMVVDSHNFSWSYSDAEVTTSGTPSVTITPATMESAPKPDTLTAELYIDETLVYTDEVDIYQDFFADNTTDPDQASYVSGDITFYFYPSADGSPYPCDTEPSVRWEFTLTDTDGTKYTDTLSW